MRGDRQISRRTMLQGAALGAAGLLPGMALAADRPRLPPGLPPGEYESDILEAPIGKKPLIKHTWRPPNYETPVSYFASPVTPNDAFFVRYHLANIPDAAALRDWKLTIGGEGVGNPLTLTLADLQNGFAPVEIAAVCQCSGNRRGFSDPHVPGVQWGLGAMGSASWTGARLKDVLAKAGLRKETVEIVVNGADGPVLEKTPDFVKSIPVWKALDDNTIIAYRMNGAPIPLLNGFPARLVVPGWTATYWMKHLDSIEASLKPFDGFWMKSAYRIPLRRFPVVEHFQSQMTETSEPITEIMVNSVIAAPAEGQRLAAGNTVQVRGVAWDGGFGIDQVTVSTDGGRRWHEASLGKDFGRFAFREWSFRFTPDRPGRFALLAKARNAVGQTQADSLIFNPAGYHNNVARPVTITVA